MRLGVGGEISSGYPVNAGGSLVGLHPFPRSTQVVGREHRLHEVCIAKESSLQKCHTPHFLWC